MVPEEDDGSILPGPNAGNDEGLSFSSEGETKPTEEPREEAAPTEEVSDKTKEEPLPEDSEIELPDKTKAKWSEVQAWRDGQMKASDYTQKTQSLAEERREFERYKAQVEEGYRRILENPSLYEQVRQERGLGQRVVDPFNAPDQWVNARRQQYIQAGMQEQATQEQLQMDLLMHQNKMLMERQTRSEREWQERSSAAKAEQEAVALERTLSGLFAKPEYQAASTQVGREMVEGLIAREINAGRQPNYEAIVRRVAQHHAEVIKGHIEKKQEKARVPGQLSKGGGLPKPATKKNYGADLDSFRNMAYDRHGGNQGG